MGVNKDRPKTVFFTVSIWSLVRRTFPDKGEVTSGDVFFALSRARVFGSFSLGRLRDLGRSGEIVGVAGADKEETPRPVEQRGLK